MYDDALYEKILASSQRAAWQIEDVLPDEARLDLARPLLPEALARSETAPGLNQHERLTLNHISGHTYLGMFGLVEEFILPFVLDHARPQLAANDWRTRALLNFAGEEAKHIQLFKKFATRFAHDFGEACPMIGPAQAIADRVLSEPPLAVALVVLQVEWMTQAHYLESIHEERSCDPLFKSLLKHHWIEEASHARLDALMVEALAEGCSSAEKQAALDGYEAIIRFLEKGLSDQVQLNLSVLERKIGRTLPARERDALHAQQHRAACFTYLGSGLSHHGFCASMKALGPAFAERRQALAASLS